MRQKREHAILIAASIVGGILAASAAMAQNAATPSLLEQLQAQYKLTKTTFTSGLVTITEPGTVLVIRKGGILGCPPGNLTLAPATFKGGSLNPPGKIAAAMCGKNARQIPSGEKVYVTKIDANLKKDKISFRIIECDSCNGATQPSSYKADVFFEFPKGSLATTSVPDVEDTIAKVFAIDTGGSEVQPPQPGTQPEQPGQPTGQPEQPAQPAVQPEQPAVTQPAPAPAAPVEIKLGQTIDQVVAALGQPEKIVDLGSRKIYVYKDLKITFVDGKVSDVQ
jgi:hypothetical protein